MAHLPGWCSDPVDTALSRLYPLEQGQTLRLPPLLNRSRPQNECPVPAPHPTPSLPVVLSHSLGHSVLANAYLTCESCLAQGRTWGQVCCLMVRVSKTNLCPWVSWDVEDSLQESKPVWDEATALIVLFFRFKQCRFYAPLSHQGTHVRSPGCSVTGRAEPPSLLLVSREGWVLLSQAQHPRQRPAFSQHPAHTGR